MNSFIRRIASGASVLAASAAVVGLLPAAAQAATSGPAVDPVPRSAAYECGFMHVNGETAYYNHCGNTHVMIQVNHVFGDDTYFCAQPGIQPIPNGNNSWGIIYAAYDGQLC